MGDEARTAHLDGGILAALARERLEAVDPTRTLDVVIRRLFDRDQYTVSAFGASL